MTEPVADVVGVVQDFIAERFPAVRAVTKVPGDKSFDQSLPIVRVSSAGGPIRMSLHSARISLLVLARAKTTDGKDVPAAARSARVLYAQVVQAMQLGAAGFTTEDGYISGVGQATLPTPYDYGNPAAEAVAGTVDVFCHANLT